MLQRNGGLTASLFLGCALLCALVVAQPLSAWADGADNTIEMNGRIITMTTDASAIASSTDQHIYVQTKGALDSADRERLLSLGVEVRQYVMNNTYVMFCKAGSANALLADPAVKGCAPISVQDKITSSTTQSGAAAGSDTSTAGSTAPAAPRWYLVRGHAGVDAADIQQLLAQDGLQATIVSFGRGHACEVQCTPADAARIATLDPVATVSLTRKTPATDNIFAQLYTRSNTAQLPPLSLDGTGITVLVRDGGEPSHIDYNSRLTALESPGVDQHHTHVTGTVGGNGTLDPLGEGMAPNVTLVSNDFNGNNTDELQDPFTNNGAKLSNHSYGLLGGWGSDGNYYNSGDDEEFGFYGTTAVEFDTVIAANDLIVVMSAGNDRGDPNFSGLPHMHSADGFSATFTDSHPSDGPYNSVSGAQMGKNIITVGAVDQDDSMSSFSSWGGIGSARVIPTVVSDGVDVFSTFPGNSYGVLSGTSMSSPATTGSVALFLQKYFDDNAMTLPTAALTKAALAHGARDLTEVDGPNYRVGPDFTSGFGAVDVVNSIALIEATIPQADNAESSVINGGNFNQAVPNVRSCEPLKVTLAWTDPEGAVGASNPLINDLDLTVVGPAPDNTVFFPFRLNAAFPTLTATKGVNTVDVIEQVVIPFPPEEGTYTINVDGTSVPMAPQNFAVTWSTLSGQVPASTVRVSTNPNTTTIQAGTVINITGDACGGLPPYTYQFWMIGPGTGNEWQNVRPFSLTDTFTWTTDGLDVGTTTVRIWAKSTMSTNVRDVIVDLQITVTEPPGLFLPTSLDLVGDVNDGSGNPLPVPYTAGTAVRLQAENLLVDDDPNDLTPPAPPGAPADYRYQFWQIGPGTGNEWTIVQPFSAQTFFEWGTTATNIGTTTTRVWVKHKDSSAVRDAFVDLVSTVIAGGGPGVSITPNVPSPQAAGALVTFTATPGAGLIAPVTYKFWIKGPGTGGVFVQGQDFSTNNQFVWDTTTHAGGNTTIRVWAKGNGSPNVRDAIADTTFDVTSTTAATAVSLSSLQPSPVSQGTPFTLVAAASGGTGTYEYQFWGFSDATDWVLLQAYSSLQTATVQPPGSGTTKYRVWARSVGSANARDAIADISLYANPTPPSFVGVSASMGRNVDATSRTVFRVPSFGVFLVAPQIELATLASPGGQDYEYNVTGPAIPGLPTGYGPSNDTVLVEQVNALTGTASFIDPANVTITTTIVSPATFTSQVRSVGSINAFDLQDSVTVNVPLPATSLRLFTNNMPPVITAYSVLTSDGTPRRGDLIQLLAARDDAVPPCDTDCAEWEYRWLASSPPLGVGFDEIFGWRSIAEEPDAELLLLDSSPFITWVDLKIEVRAASGEFVGLQVMSSQFRINLAAPSPTP